MLQQAKVNLRNFGADKIFVISDKNNTQRRKDFVEAWNCFSGFDFEFIDAIMGENIDINSLLQDGSISPTFNCSIGSLSKNIIGVALSHKKTWQYILSLRKDKSIYSKYKDWYLILEDDVRPTEELCEAIFNGEYKKILKEINQYDMDFIYWGKAKRPYVKGEIFNKYFVKPYSENDYAAHAYMVKPTMIESMVNMYKVNMPVDVYIDKTFKNDIFATHKCFIQQQGHLIGKFIMAPFDEDFLYSTGTQVNPHVIKTTNDEYERIHPDIRDNVYDVHKNNNGYTIFLK